MDGPAADEREAGQEAPTKARARAAVRGRRRARPAQQREDAALGLARVVLGHLAAPGPARSRVVAAYVSAPTEPGTAPLRAALADRGVDVLLPVVTGGPLAWVLDGEDGRPATLRHADVVLLPALAVTATGHRLGQGGGHYDRTLADLGAADAALPLLVALVHDDEVLAEGGWPVEAHDVRVDAVATPSRWSDVVRAR